jgi:16S rRNA A1518/A1519 N6-dimethyltransferase RsmA/KsgA/DIM1 with predicted DNA glycosylase/AP lyase activity
MPTWTTDPATYSSVFAQLCACAMPGLLRGIAEIESGHSQGFIVDVGAGTGEATGLVAKRSGEPVIAVEPHQRFNGKWTKHFGR